MQVCPCVHDVSLSTATLLLACSNIPGEAPGMNAAKISTVPRPPRSRRRVLGPDISFRPRGEGVLICAPFPSASALFFTHTGRDGAALTLGHGHRGNAWQEIALVQARAALPAVSVCSRSATRGRPPSTANAALLGSEQEQVARARAIFGADSLDSQHSCTRGRLPSASESAAGGTARDQRGAI